MTHAFSNTGFAEGKFKVLPYLVRFEFLSLIDED